MDPLFATILILIVTNQDIILAADSRKTSIDQDGIRSTETMDKIYQTQEYFYAVSGLDSSGDQRFSIHSIIHNILQQCAVFDKAIELLSHELARALKEYVSGIKEYSAELFKRLLQYNASGGEIVIIKNVRALPTAYLLEYKIKDGTEINIILNTWKIDINRIKDQGECFWRAIGNTTFLEPDRYSQLEISMDPVAHVRHIIEKGIKEYPKFVGPPINILKLNKYEAYWVQKSPATPKRIL